MQELKGADGAERVRCGPRQARILLDSGGARAAPVLCRPSASDTRAGGFRGAIRVQASHFERRHGRIAATCPISNCRRSVRDLFRICADRSPNVSCFAVIVLRPTATSPNIPLRRAFACFVAGVARHRDGLSDRLCKTRHPSRQGASQGRARPSPLAQPSIFFTLRGLYD